MRGCELCVRRPTRERHGSFASGLEVGGSIIRPVLHYPPRHTAHTSRWPAAVARCLLAPLLRAFCTRRATPLGCWRRIWHRPPRGLACPNSTSKVIFTHCGNYRPINLLSINYRLLPKTLAQPAVRAPAFHHSPCPARFPARPALGRKCAAVAAAATSSLRPGPLRCGGLLRCCRG